MHKWTNESYSYQRSLLNSNDNVNSRSLGSWGQNITGLPVSSTNEIWTNCIEFSTRSWYVAVVGAIGFIGQIRFQFHGDFISDGSGVYGTDHRSELRSENWGFGDAHFHVNQCISKHSDAGSLNSAGICPILEECAGLIGAHVNFVQYSECGGKLFP